MLVAQLKASACTFYNDIRFGEMLKVTKISGDAVYVENKHGREFSLDLDDIDITEKSDDFLDGYWPLCEY